MPRKSKAWWVIYNALCTGSMDQMEAAQEADVLYNNLAARDYITTEGKKVRNQEDA